MNYRFIQATKVILSCATYEDILYYVYCFSKAVDREKGGKKKKKSGKKKKKKKKSGKKGKKKKKEKDLTPDR